MEFKTLFLVSLLVFAVSFKDFTNADVPAKVNDHESNPLKFLETLKSEEACDCETPCDSNNVYKISLPPITGTCTTTASFTITSVDQVLDIANQVNDGLECLFWAGLPQKTIVADVTTTKFIKSFCPRFGNTNECLWGMNRISQSVNTPSGFVDYLILKNGKTVVAPVRLAVPVNLRSGEYTDGLNVVEINLCSPRNEFMNFRGNEETLRSDCNCGIKQCRIPSCNSADLSGIQTTLPLTIYQRLIGNNGNQVFILEKLMLKTCCGFETVGYYVSTTNNPTILADIPPTTTLTNPTAFTFTYPCSSSYT